MATLSKHPWALVGGTVSLLLDIVAPVTWNRPIRGQTMDLLGSDYPLTSVRSIGARRGSFQAFFENDADRNVAKQALLDALGNMAVPYYVFVPGYLREGSTMDVTAVAIDASVNITEDWGPGGERLLRFGLVEVATYGGGPIL